MRRKATTSPRDRAGWPEAERRVAGKLGASRSACTLAAFAIAFATGAILSSAPAAAQSDEGVTVTHGLFLFGGLQYGPDFKNFDYANPDAPKGGAVVLSANGSTFDSLNPYIVKGTPALGLGFMQQSLTTDSLMVQNDGEPSSEYGLIAESVAVPKDKSWAEFTLRANARWADGTPITPADAIFSFDILKAKGLPLYRNYYRNVTKAEQTGPRKVRFAFSEKGNNELPFIIGELPVLSKAYWSGHAFDETTTTPPLSNGAYKISKVDIGRSITYERDPNYWGKDLPVNKGRFNIATVRYDYYRDQSVALEAFKAGKVDFRSELSAKNWATEYDLTAVRDGRIIKQLTHPANGDNFQGFLYNIRKPVFKDAKVREALGYAFDFEWANKNIFYNQYARTRSYFEGTELESKGLPTPAELKLLEPFRAELDPRVFTKEFNPPKTEATDASLRANLRTAVALLNEAGWTIKDGKLVPKQGGAQFAFQILTADAASERVVAPFVNNLKLLGIDASFRMVDDSQYIARVQNFDFDMIIAVLAQSLSPGNEQRDFWGADAADRPGSQNYIGIKSKVVDALAEAVIFAPDREALITATHALDRVLQWGFYTIPELHGLGARIAYWDKFGRPATLPKHADPSSTPWPYLQNWWIDPAKARALGGQGASAAP
ncbi:MAG: extracellular solute-binding protein [Gammaproteobacteria bacterium]